jgi:protein disulfide-isomerase
MNSSASRFARPVFASMLALGTLLALPFAPTPSLAAASAEAGSALWTEDFAAASAKAAASKRPLLLDFTGSDWCGWCVKLDKEVFQKSDFQSFSTKHLELVKLDFPKSKPQTDAVKAQNASLKEKYQVRGYPTLVLLSPEGKELKRWVGFKPAFLSELKQAVEKP